MAHPVKVAKQMFDQFLSKADPQNSPTGPEPLFSRSNAAKEKRARKRGGLARATSLTAQKRRQIARRAAKVRWSKSSPTE